MGAGLTWYFHEYVQNIAAFGEYRFTHFEADFRFNDGGVATGVAADVDTHHLVVGISYRF